MHFTLGSREGGVSEDGGRSTWEGQRLQVRQVRVGGWRGSHYTSLNGTLHLSGRVPNAGSYTRTVWVKLFSWFLSLLWLLDCGTSPATDVRPASLSNLNLTKAGVTNHLWHWCLGSTF